MKLAYLCMPHLGGTFTVYNLLRDGLGVHGHDVRWVGVNAAADPALVDHHWALEDASGYVVGHPDQSEREQVRALISLLESAQFDGVFVNVLTSQVEMNAIRYLDPRITRIMLVHNITPGTYAAARSLRDYVHATVGVSPRIRQDLVGRFRFDPKWTFCIPHGTTVTAGAGRDDPRPGSLRVISIGRIEDAAKGVFWLPRILERVQVEIRLTIAGDGPDLPELRRRCEPLGDRVTFLGGVTSSAVPALFGRHDVLLMPSRYEGFGMTVIEAMAAGCVPLVTRIKDVTDAIVADGLDGFLFAPGDVAAAARMLTFLATTDLIRHSMAANARAAVERRFSVSAMADGYARMIEQVRRCARAVEPALAMDQWRVPSGMRPGLRTYVPTPIKNYLRVLRERIIQ